MDTPVVGSLADYDMVFSITQKAINNQFSVLFDTPNPKSPDVNLIPNVMKLGYIALDHRTGKYEPTKVGITATIDCPTVDLTDIDPDGVPNRSLRFKIHMITATMTYIDTSFGDLETEQLDGWTVSWLAKLGSREIQDIEEEVMHPNAKKAIKNVVSSGDFLVSSLFCLFESTQIADSFVLTDSKGKKANDSIALGLMNQITVTYRDIDHKKFPYILGYGISQNADKSGKSATKAVFTPSKFTLSTTPYKEDKDQATLNFCMITNSDVNLPTNPSAGTFNTPFAYETGAANLKSDGVFAVSQNLLSEKWLKATVMDKMDLGPNLAKKLNAKCDPPVYSGQGTTKLSKKTTWKGDWVDGSPDYQHSGYSTIDITFRSALQDNPSGEIPVNIGRTLTLDLKGEIYTKVDLGKEGYVDATSRLTASLLITSANDGTWSVEKKIWKVPDGSPDKGDHIKWWAKMLEYLEAIFAGPAGVLGSLDLLIVGLAGAPTENFDTIKDTFKSPSNTVIMPCGDICTFLGLDCDDSGNLYSHIKYKTSL